MVSFEFESSASGFRLHKALVCLMGERGHGKRHPPHRWRVVPVSVEIMI